MYGLSKSKYCQGVQCPKILWMNEHKPELAVPTALPSAMATGTKVGELARGYFGSYDLVPFDKNVQAMCDATAALMHSGVQNIAEASFLYDGLYCAVDILHRDGDGWDIVEVKSGTKWKDAFADDMAFQYYVLTQCGVKVNAVYNMLINGGYVRKGALDIKKLFTLDDCTDMVRDTAQLVPQLVSAMRSYTAATDEPAQPLGLYCEQPHDCPYRSHCFRNIPADSVFSVAGMQAAKKYQLYQDGVVTFPQLLAKQKADKRTLTPAQLVQVQSVCSNVPETIHAANVKAFVDSLQYPIYHLDFETFQQVIPEFDGCRPYEQLPFQYSLHIEHEDGRLEHKEFLAEGGTDPRRAVAEHLVQDIPADAFAMAYNMSFERGTLAHLAEWFPDLADHLLAIRDNMHDLMVPFQQKDYYTTAMQGSYSIKYVLPALWPNDPELDYHNLDEVHNGTEASAAFASMAALPPEELAALRANLLKYCGLDTYAMVKVLRRLREVAEAVKSTAENKPPRGRE